MKKGLLLLNLIIIGGCSRTTPPKPEDTGIQNEKGEKIIVGTRMERVEKGIPRTPVARFHEKRYTIEERMILKNILFSLGYPVNTKTDTWDEISEQGVRQFQKEYSIKPTGRIETETLWALANVIRESKLVTITGDERKTIPFNYPFWKAYMKTKQVNPGDILKYFDYESGKFKYAEVESISGNEARLYDYEKDKYYYIDIDDIE